MAQIFSLPSPDRGAVHGLGQAGGDVIQVEDFLHAHVHCSLCGAPISRTVQRFTLVSPLGGGEQVTVCRTCYRAALGEGYRPAI
jgi:hypothetical protein